MLRAFDAFFNQSLIVASHVGLLESETRFHLARATFSYACLGVWRKFDPLLAL
jgi:hypothetical protein